MSTSAPTALPPTPLSPHPQDPSHWTRPARDLLICLTLGMAWYGLIQIRPSLTTFHCAAHAQACTREGIAFPPDRWIVGLDSPLANSLSFATEYAAALLALSAPWLSTWRKETLPVVSGLKLWVPLFQATLLNGVWMETIRNWVQRPRPFVYEAPLAYGKVVSHYTSFYSGHTSFAALASFTAWLICRRLEAPPATTRKVAQLGLALTFLTGLFRVLAARHFITDVLFGALAGVLASLCIHHFLKTASPTPEQPHA